MTKGLREIWKMARGGGGAFLVSGTALQAMVAFAANLVLVRFIAPEAFGRFAILLAATGVVFGLLSLRPGVLILRHNEDALDDRKRALYFTVMSLETLLGLCVVLPWVVVLEGAESLGMFLVLAIALNHWVRQNKGFFERAMPYGRLAAVESGTAFAAHGLSVGLVLFGMGEGALYLREAFAAFVGLVMLWLVGGVAFFSVCLPSLAEWRALLREARGVWLDGVLEGSFQRLVIIAVGALSGAGAAGYFFQAQRLAMVPHQVLAPLVNRIALIWFGQASDEAVREAGRRNMVRGLFPLLVAGALGAVFLADPVVPFLFGEAWRPVVPLLVALSGAILFISLFEINRAYCLAGKLSRYLIAARLVQYMGFFGCLGAAVLLGADGGAGAAVGLSIAFAGAFVLLEIILRGRKPETGGSA